MEKSALISASKKISENAQMVIAELQQNEGQKDTHRTDPLGLLQVSENKDGAQKDKAGIINAQYSPESEFMQQLVQLNSIEKSALLSASKKISENAQMVIAELQQNDEQKDAHSTDQEQISNLPWNECNFQVCKVMWWTTAYFPCMKACGSRPALLQVTENKGGAQKDKAGIINAQYSPESEFMQ